MKKLAPFFALIAMLIVACTIGACNDARAEREERIWFETLCDSVADNIYNHAFTTETSIVQYQSELIHDREVQNIFCEMDERAVAQIAHMILKNHHNVRVIDIVDEYWAHKNVYDNVLEDPYAAPRDVPDTFIPETEDEIPDSLKQL